MCSSDLTYVWTCAVMKDGGNELRSRFSAPKAHAWEFGHWIKLLNVDAPTLKWQGNNRFKPPEQSWQEQQFSTDFEKKWAEERTYKRWEEGGTFYGFSSHCGAMLGHDCKEPPLAEIFGGVYFDQTLLLLYLRTTLFRFSVRLNQITTEAMDKIDGNKDSEWQIKFQVLRCEFTQFANLYQYPLLSNQQQGIELYTLARSQMDVDLLFKEIKDQIHGSHDYFTIKQTHEQTTITTRLTVVATIGLACALTFGFLAIPMLNDQKHMDNLQNVGLVVGVLFLFLFLVGIVIANSDQLGKLLNEMAKSNHDKEKDLL